MNMNITKNVTEANAITHGGVFHADDVLATVILRRVFGELTVCRTFRVPENLDEAGVVVYDIGGGKFDHHQKGGNGARENGVPYSSVGLLWKEFGHDIVEDTCNPDLVWELVDRQIIQGIDARDNGVLPMADYPAQGMLLSDAISSFNPNWDSLENSDEAFLRAVSFAETVFENVLQGAISKANAQGIVDAAIGKAENHIMVLDRFAPWQDFIFANEGAADILFVVFPSNRGGYNWQCVPDAPGSFGQRKSVPKAWCGLRDADLQKVTGVATATFCHQNGFLGAADTLEDAIKMATLAVEA